MKSIVHISLLGLIQICCSGTLVNSGSSYDDPAHEIVCDESGCRGTYTGPEFINGDDIAHQFSNHMSKAVGDKLKEVYKNGQYRKVNFSKIVMTTNGMGTGNVVYNLSIPFLSVETKCEAFTSFDHVGGWSHAPARQARLKRLSTVTMKGHPLDVSELKKTPEGLQEYWIQWKNRKTQAACQ